MLSWCGKRISAILSEKAVVLLVLLVGIAGNCGLIAINQSHIIHSEMDYRAFHAASRFLIWGNIGVILIGGPLLVCCCPKVRQVIALVPVLACAVYVAMVFSCSYPEARWTSSITVKFAIGELIFAFVLLLVDVIVVGVSAYLYKFFRFLRQSQTLRNQNSSPAQKNQFR